MVTDERTQELIKGLYDAVINMNEDITREISQAVLEEGVDAYYAVTHGLTAGMDKVGELYVSKEYFVPVLTYMELAGLLLGWDPYDIIGIQFHTVPVEPLLDKIGIPYDESKAWLGKDGQTLFCADPILKATAAVGEVRKGQVLE